MSASRAFGSRVLGLFAKRNSEQRLDEELEFHLEMQTEENVRRGMPAEEARRAARLAIGGLDAVKESWRDRRGIPAIETVLHDLRYALRIMRRAPAFTATVVLVLALGIGAGTAVYSILYTLMLRPLPYPHSERLVGLGEVNLKQAGGTMLGPVRYLNYADWRAQSQVFSGMSITRRSYFNVNAAGSPERVRGERVGHGYFAVFDMPPARGRTFSAEDFTVGAPRVAVVSDRYWKAALGGRADALGRTVRIDGQPAIVVGIMPPRFRAALTEGGALLWIPLALDPNDAADREAFDYSVLARLKPRVPIERARADLETIARRLAEQYPATNRDWRVNVGRIEDQLMQAARAPIVRLLGTAVVLLLAIACANVANLLLARGAERRKEMALRLAMGAGRLRIARQLMLENLVYAAAGGLAGVAVAYGAVSGLAKFSFIFQEIGASGFSVDGRVLLFALGVSAVTGLAFGIVPAVRGSRSRINDTLKESGAGYSAGGRKRRAAGALVISEVALSLVLLITAAFVLRSMSQFWTFDWGFPIDRRLSAAVALSDGNYREPARREAFFRDLLERTAALPGVSAAALTSTSPLGGRAPMARVRLEPAAPAEASAAYRAVTPDYLRALGVALRRGRFFNERESETVAVINETMASRAWKTGEEALGRRIEIGGKWRTVVGVMADIVNQGLLGTRVYEVVVPLAQEPAVAVMLIIRTAGDPLALQRPVERTIHELDPELPVQMRTFEALHAEVCSPFRFVFALIGSFALIAVSLAAAGIYGVTSRSVAVRSREIGIRMALGAARSRVVGDILRQGLWLALAGVVPGALLSLVLLKVLLSKLWWVKASAPGVVAPVAVLLTVIALTACWVPARRATRVEPAATLRAE